MTNHSHKPESTTGEQATRYVVGIDLGTTNSAVCYVDTAESKWQIRTFSIPQLVAAGLVELRETLPSFHYEPHVGELGARDERREMRGEESGVYCAELNKNLAPHPSPLAPRPSYVVGTYARDHGGKTAGRLIASAKSWLCHSGVDRTSKFLPWQAADDVTKLSPVDVTARYLSHIRIAWDHAFSQHLLAEQDVVITLPASFDEVARELTIRAARAAGIPKIVLLEEPQAAFYAWMYERGEGREARGEGSVECGVWSVELNDELPGRSTGNSKLPETLLASRPSSLVPSSKILVCDIGGGTTDLTLIRVRAKEGARDEGRGTREERREEWNEGLLGRGTDDSQLQTPNSKLPSPLTPHPTPLVFHRVAVGDHLILGGDNLDLALAHHLERKGLGARGEGREERISHHSARVWEMLVRIACDVKEKLLVDDAPEASSAGVPAMTVSLPSVGSKLIGGAKQIEVTREEVEQLLVDGFMPFVPLDAKPSRHQSGVREFGLPYATDHAITRYLAQFLTTHRHAGSTDDERENDSPLPDFVLLNGGMFEAAKMRQRLMEQLSLWKEEFETAAGNVSDRLETATFSINRSLTFPAAVPRLLENTRLDLAVARGAAYYGMVRRGYGERISAGLARTYYLGIETSVENAECRIQNAESELCNPKPLPQPAEITLEIAEQAVIDKRQNSTLESNHSAFCTLHSALNSTLLCLLPAGMEADHEVTLDDRTFDLLVGEPIQFPVFVSSVRLTDRTGELLPFNPLEMTALPPIQTVIKRKGRGTRGEGLGNSVAVQLTGKLTEIGTLELWCVERNGKGRWRLDFDVRSVTQTDRDAVATIAERDGIVDEETWQPVQEALATTFAEAQRAESKAQIAELPANHSKLTPHPSPLAPYDSKPNRLMRRLDEASNMRRDDWPTSLLRRIGDELIECFFDGRRKSPEHEARWLNLIGYAYRPGYGLSLDDWRIEQLWRKVQGNLISKTMDCRLQNWVLWRRVAGGLSAGQQKTLADPLIGNVHNLHRQATTGLGRGADMDLYSQEGAEIWRLLGSLERLPVETKVELGDMILDLFRKKKAAPVYAAMIWAIGRLGSRELMYGPLNTIVPPQTAEQWLRKIIGDERRETRGERRETGGEERGVHRAELNKNLSPHPFIATEQLAVMQLARKTGDRYRDIGQSTRELALETLENREHLAVLVREIAQLDTDEQTAVFGETLPLGLRLRH